MIWRTMIFHDFQRMIKDFRFIVLLVCSVILFALNGFMFSVKYQEVQNIYSELTATATEPWGVRQFGGSFDPMPTNGAPSYPRPSTIATELYVPPNPLSFLATGRTAIRPDAYDVRPGGIIAPFHEAGRNTFLDKVASIDWAYIIIMLYVVFAILFGHSAVSSERENGTLMLVMSNPVKRAILIIARYFSVMAILLIPLLLGGAIGILIYLIQIPDILSGYSVARILLFACTTFLVISLFTFLSLGLSSYIRRSSFSLMLLLLAWMVFLTFPYVSNVLVSFSNKDRTATYYKEQQHEMISAYEKRMISVFQQPASPDFIGYFSSTDDAMNAILQFENDIHRDIQRNYEQYLQTSHEKIAKIRSLNRITPIGLYLNACESIADSGILSEERFWNNVKSFSTVYDMYVQDRVGGITIEGATWLDPNIVHVAFIDDNRGMWTYKFGDLDGPTEYDGDKSDFPGFEYQAASIGSIVHDLIVDTAGLLIWNLVLAMGAILAINRADVR